MEIVSCADSGCIESSGGLEIFIAVSSLALAAESEASGRRRCGGLADRAGHVASDECPVALGSCIKADLVLLLVYKDQPACVAAVALGLLVHRGTDSINSSVCGDRVTADLGIGRDRSVSKNVVGSVSYIEPSRLTLLGSLIIEVHKFALDGHEAGVCSAVLGGIQIIIASADLAVTGQDRSLALCADLRACIVLIGTKLKPLDLHQAFGVKSIKFAADVVNTALISSAVHVVLISRAGFLPAVRRCLCCHRKALAGSGIHSGHA